LLQPRQQLWEMGNRLSPPKHTAETDRRPRTTTGWSTSGGSADARQTDTKRKRRSLLRERKEALISLFSRQMNEKCKYTLILRPQNMCWHGQHQRSPSPQNHPRKHTPFVACHPAYKSIFSSWPRNDSFLGFSPSLPDLTQNLPALGLNSGRDSPVTT